MACLGRVPRRVACTVLRGVGRSNALHLPGRAAPRTDPSVRNYRTGLLARVQRRFASSPNRRTRSSAPGTPDPALCPGRVVLAAFPSRCPLPSTISAATQRLVRRLRRYYEAVRLPTTVHLGRAALAFPERPAPFPVGGQSWDLPVLAHEDSAHAQVLRPRGVRWRLAHNAASDVAFRLS